MNEIMLKIQYDTWQWGKSLVTSCTEWVVQYWESCWSCCEPKVCSNSFFDLDEVPKSCHDWSWTFVLWIDNWCEWLSYINLTQNINSAVTANNISLLNQLLGRIEWWTCLTVARDLSWPVHLITLNIDRDCILNWLELSDISNFPTPLIVSCDEYDIEPGTQICAPCASECVEQTLKYCWWDYYWEKSDCCEEWFRKPKIAMYLSNTVHFQQATNVEKAYYFSEVNIPELDAAWYTLVSGNWITRLKRHMITNSWWYVTIEVPWDYLMWYRSSQEQNIGAHWTRVWMLIIKQNTGSISWTVQSRYSWTDSFFYPGQPAVWSWDKSHFWDNIRTTSAWWQSNLWTDPNDATRNWWTFSMGRIMERFPNSDSIPYFLEKWDRIVPFAKFSTYITWDTEAQMTDYVWKSHNGENIMPTLSVLWANEDSADWWDAAQIWLMNVDDICDRKYWLKKYALGPFAE